jgi:hypothetical protein
MSNNEKDDLSDHGGTISLCIITGSGTKTRKSNKALSGTTSFAQW